MMLQVAAQAVAMRTEEKAPELAAPVDIGYPDCCKASIPSTSARS